MAIAGELWQRRWISVLIIRWRWVSIRDLQVQQLVGIRFDGMEFDGTGGVDVMMKQELVLAVEPRSDRVIGDVICKGMGQCNLGVCATAEYRGKEQS